jgi:hypothetical protein
VCRCADAPVPHDAASGRAREGKVFCLDQVWNAPSADELVEEYLAANQHMLDVLEGPSKKFQERS